LLRNLATTKLVFLFFSAWSPRNHHVFFFFFFFSLGDLAAIRSFFFSFGDLMVTKSIQNHLEALGLFFFA
jgi:hypothetical protein